MKVFNLNFTIVFVATLGFCSSILAGSPVCKKSLYRVAVDYDKLPKFDERLRELRATNADFAKLTSIDPSVEHVNFDSALEGLKKLQALTGEELEQIDFYLNKYLDGRAREKDMATYAEVASLSVFLRSKRVTSDRYYFKENVGKFPIFSIYDSVDPNNSPIQRATDFGIAHYGDSDALALANKYWHRSVINLHVISQQADFFSHQRKTQSPLYDEDAHEAFMQTMGVSFTFNQAYSEMMKAMKSLELPEFDGLRERYAGIDLRPIFTDQSSAVEVAKKYPVNLERAKKILEIFREKEAVKKQEFASLSAPSSENAAQAEGFESIARALGKLTERRLWYESLVKAATENLPK